LPQSQQAPLHWWRPRQPPPPRPRPPRAPPDLPCPAQHQKRPPLTRARRPHPSDERIHEKINQRTSWAFNPAMFTIVDACIIGGQSRLTQAAQPTPGSEQPDAQARARVLAVEGIEFLEQERWVEAQARLSQAYALFQAPTVAVLEARALEQLGRLNEAYARYRQASELPINRASPKAFRRAVAQAQQEQTRLDSIIPTLAVRLSAPGSEQTIQVNGKPLRKAEWGKPQRLDPGAYTMEALD